MFTNQGMMESDKNVQENGDKQGDKYGLINKEIYVSVGTQTKTQEEDQTATATMWHIIETGIGLKVPVYLKNIMRLEGYNTTIAIQRLSVDNIKELELFGRTEMLKFIKKGEKHSDYFDKYHICPSEFHIPTGHKVLLSEIQKFVTNKLSTDKMYFMPELRIEKPKCQTPKLTKCTNQRQKVCISRTASELKIKTPRRSLRSMPVVNQIQTFPWTSI